MYEAKWVIKTQWTSLKGTKMFPHASHITSMCILLWEPIFELWNSIYLRVLDISLLIYATKDITPCIFQYMSFCNWWVYITKLITLCIYKQLILLWPFPCIVWLLHYLAYGSVFVYLNSLSRKYFTFICEDSKLHNTLFKMFPLCFMVLNSSISWGSFSSRAQSDCPDSTYGVLFLRSCYLIPIAYSINRMDVWRFFILYIFYVSSTWYMTLVYL